MNVLVTGGAGFIGRWVVKQLLDDGHNVWVVDNLSNGSLANLQELIDHANLKRFIQADIQNQGLLDDLFQSVNFDLCYHLAANINVQDSINDPEKTFLNDTVATFYILERCKENNVKMVFMSTCMVYDGATNGKIDEHHPTKPASPYAGAKIAAENIVLSYYFAYGLPTVVIRPFNTYGPYQKSNSEGGVVSIFIKNKLKGVPVNIYGDGNQTRDLLYVEDCAKFVVEAGYSDRANGEILNAGLGEDISINDLALLILKDEKMIHHVEHIHPQSEIEKLICNYDKANELLGWAPVYSLAEGIDKTEQWLKTQFDLREI